MGGGRQMLQTHVTETETDPIDTWAGRRNDGRNLINDWITDKKGKNAAFSVVQTNQELAAVDHKNTDYLLGIFANGHIPMDFKRDKSPKGQPSLEEMTVAALKILRKSDEGYLLVVNNILYNILYTTSSAEAIDI